MAQDTRVDVFSSENRANIPVYPLDVYAATDAGLAQVRSGATRLPPDALEVLVLLDGKATVGDLEQKLPHLPPAGVRDLLRALLSAGFARAATIEETEGFDFSTFFTAAGADPDATGGANASALREAEHGAPALQREGYYVSIARQAVAARQPAGGARLSVLIVEDDPDMAALVERLLCDAGFDAETAASRDHIMARLRRQPSPDLILLDVNLPDVNGFDVLQRLKAHPVLKAIAVIMLTADAQRESIVRGLAGGADGYVTKPFERGSLLAGVKAVLGLPA